MNWFEFISSDFIAIVITVIQVSRWNYTHTLKVNIPIIELCTNDWDINDIFVLNIFESFEILLQEIFLYVDL